MNQPDLSFRIRDVVFPNCVMPASGCFGYSEEAAKIAGFEVSRLGAQVSKGTTLLPREGNAQPRIQETPSGMINRIGLENPGIEVVIREKIPFMMKFGNPLIINISGFSISDYVEMAVLLNSVSFAQLLLELNISCPNVKGGGIIFGLQPEAAAEVVSAVRAVTQLPLIVKLTPNAWDIREVAKAVAASGADAISLINTYKAYFMHQGKIYQGGLSGPAIKPMALGNVSLVAGVVDLPIIGMGGISDYLDALEFIKAGASGIAVGTAAFKNPLCLMQIIDGLTDYCLKQSITNLSQLRGKVQIKY